MTVGLAFVALALLALWRGHRLPGTIAASLGVLLALAGLIAPAALGPVYRGWMAFALAISKVTTPILLGIVYFLAFLPIALVMRLAGKRPMKRRETAESFWVSRDPAIGRRGDLTRQF
ncbi:MAG: SxtJ family membrane protein [Gemmatimonadaceae bacterium]